MFKRLKNLWKLSAYEPVVGQILQKDNQTVILEKKIFSKKRPATIVLEDPLQIFPDEQ